MEQSQSRSRHFAVTAALIAVTLAGLAWAMVQVKTYQFVGANPNQTRTIVVSGEGKTFVKPDIATVQVSVSSDSGASDLTAVQSRNAEKTNAITNFLKTEGVKEEDIKTANYAIFPRYNYSQSGQQFLGYTVRQDIQVKIRDLAKVGAILNGAVTHGANEVSGLQFTVDNPKEAEEKVRDEAIEDAKKKAERLAASLGVKLARLTAYSEGSNGGPVPVPFEAFGKGMGGGAAPDIQVGQNEIRSQVTLTYEIE